MFDRNTDPVSALAPPQRKQRQQSAVGRPGEWMPPFLDQRLSAAYAFAAACCECSLQLVHHVVLSGSIVLTLELARSRLGNITSQVRLLVVPVKRVEYNAQFNARAVRYLFLSLRAGMSAL